MQTRRTQFDFGFTIVELLIALAITGILMAAVAVAFNAAVINCRENEDIFAVVNSARQAMHRVTAQLRTAEAVDPNSPASECALITCDGDDITFRYDSNDAKLYLVTNDVTTDSDYVLCDNVTAMTFAKETAVEESVTYVKDVRITMTVARGNVEKTVSAGAAIRRNLD
jgi:prepilin-type N-terminal cleavage/methylation domain-containing protein